MESIKDKGMVKNGNVNIAEKNIQTKAPTMII
jgi:hypothetical protein